MTSVFVSYAQNFEDVMLRRALNHVTNGFYIDVGAYLPRKDSVTLAFYERGWSGINIEPNAQLHREFLLARPRDINLRVAVGERSDEMTMYVVSNPGLTTLDERQAVARTQEGLEVVPEVVRVETLASIWGAHVPADQPVHFLKVDVEGFEQQVLLGNDWDTNRPWIVVVEATRPMTNEASHDAWEHLLLAARYRFAYADGLNRFYVADEHAALAAALKFPPNFFDDFIRVSELDATARATRAEAELATVMHTRSWRLTAPLRGGANLARRVGARIGRPARTHGFPRDPTAPST